MQLLTARARRRHPSTRWLPTLLITTTAFVPPTLAFPFSDLGRRLSTISPDFDVANLHTTDAFGTGTSRNSIFGSPSPPTGTISELNYAVTHPDDIPVMSTANMFSPSSQWAQSPSIGPSSLTATLQTTLDRLIVSARYNLGLPLPLAFLVGFSVVFLFVLSGLFSVFLLWEIAKGVVRGWRGGRLGLGLERGRKKGGEEREFVIRSRVVVRSSLRRGILSPLGGSRRGSEGESEGSESPCPKRVRWVDEEWGCLICAESCRVVKDGDGDGGGDLAAGGVGVDVDVEMEKVD